jgi:hypothetical protein
MLLIIPVIVGVLACMPVPIGNPERSRIDPDITGVWAWPVDDDPRFYAFEPYDKRTWLLTGVPLEEGEGADFSGYDTGSYDGLARLMENEAAGDDGATASEVILYKAWMTKLGGVWFMTWEPKGLFGSQLFAPDTWYVFRVDKTDRNTLELRLIGGRELFPDELKKTRRAYERVIRKHAKNPDLYTDDSLILERVREEHLGFFTALAGEVVTDSN